MTDPSIGILITCFNKESYIDDAIKSALKNTNRIIVIDDCSEDKSWEIIKKFKEIISYQMTENLGASAATIKGLELAIKHKFSHCILLDGDDVLAENAINHYSEIFKKTKANAIYTRFLRDLNKDSRTFNEIITNKEFKIVANPFISWLKKPVATTCLCSETKIMLIDLDPKPKVQDHQIAFSIHRNSKIVVYSEGITHYCSQPFVSKMNLSINNIKGYSSAIFAYLIH